MLWGLEHVSALLAAAQLGITLCTLVLGVVAEPAIAHLLEPVFHAVGVPHGRVHPISFVIALALATYLHMLLGEMVPKNIALAEPVRSALLLGPPLVTLARALRPVIFTVNAFANALLKLLRVETKDEVAATFSDDELARLVRDSGEAGLLDDRARRAAARRAGAGPPAGAGRGAAAGAGGLRAGGRHPGGAGAAVGRVRASPASRWWTSGRRIARLSACEGRAGRRRRATCRSRCRRLRPIARVRAATPLDDVLTAMRRSRTHLAAVLGEDGRLAGLVTMEDVLRELFGQPAA